MKNPKIRIGLTIFDIIIEIAALAALLSMWIIIITAYFKLPDIIATHFNDAGKADGFGGKSSIFLLPAITDCKTVRILKSIIRLFNILFICLKKRVK